jgi:hypothetical protein
VHILLIYPGGRQQDGLLLGGTRERMRVMMPGQADAVEFRLIEDNWMGESGASVEIGAILSPAMLPVDQPRGGLPMEVPLADARGSVLRPQ